MLSAKGVTDAQIFTSFEESFWDEAAAALVSSTACTTGTQVRIFDIAFFFLDHRQLAGALEYAKLVCTAEMSACRKA